MVDLEPIGIVHSPLETTEDAPSQGLKGDVEGRIEIDPELESGLQGLEPGDRIVVVWYADRAERDLLVMDKVPGRGVFNSRSPARPNPIAVTTCTVTSVEGTEIGVRGIDMLDGSPVLDVKATLDRDLKEVPEGVSLADRE
jgi:tRNA-Thr(GGU) m(6)t(6)A37 methyltransferase TsaA